MGPANFCRTCTQTAEWPYWSGVEQLLDHFGGGRNFATGDVGSPVDFLALSTYGMWGAAPVYKAGYGPFATAAAARLLARWRDRLVSASSGRINASAVSLEMHEFGTWVNRFWRPSQEPGAFGAAWYVANWVAALRCGVSRMFHWGWDEASVEPAPWYHRLYSSAWAMAMAEIAFADGENSSAVALDLVDLEPSLPNLTVSGLGITSVRRGSHNSSGGSTTRFLLLAALSATKDPNAPALEVCVNVSGAVAVEGEYRLDRNTSAFDAALHMLQGGGDGLLTHNDSELYPLQEMATPAGMAFLSGGDRAAKLEALQTQSFAARNFSGTVTRSVKQGVGAATICVPMTAPCTLLVQFTTA